MSMQKNYQNNHNFEKMIIFKLHEIENDFFFIFASMHQLFTPPSFCILHAFYYIDALHLNHS